MQCNKQCTNEYIIFKLRGYLCGIDSHTDKTVEIDVTVTLFELNGKKYYTVIGTDVNDEIVYTDIQENK